MGEFVLNDDFEKNGLWKTVLISTVD